MPVERSYYDNGNLRWEGELLPPEGSAIVGSPHGIIRTWHDIGVLESETPFDHGLKDGTARQWNDKGELLGTCEMIKGTGVFRTWHPNGVISYETTLIEGVTTGRERVFWDTGELVCEEFYIDNKKVSKKKYQAACEQRPELPRYEDTSARKVRPATRATSKKPTTDVSAEDMAAIAQKMLQQASTREAKAWLAEGRENDYSFGEAIGYTEAVEMVDELYSLGAVKVYVAKIEGEIGEPQNAGRLLVELPQVPRKRKKVLAYCDVLGAEQGFERSRDVGQGFTIVMLD
jgi:hypothetical protein